MTKFRNVSRCLVALFLIEMTSYEVSETNSIGFVASSQRLLEPCGSPDRTVTLAWSMYMWLHVLIVSVLFCCTGAIDVLRRAVVGRPISA